jgi:O-antigen/teichoic acid export membrane protein
MRFGTGSAGSRRWFGMTEMAVSPLVASERARKGPRSFDGAVLLSGATVASGVLAYAYHVLAARVLGPESYGLVAVLWAALFLLVVVLFRPLEQTTSRALADRLARGQEVRSVLRAMLRIYLVLALAIGVVGALGWGLIGDRLFLGDSFYTGSLVVGLAAYGVAYVARGVFAGAGWFNGYALLLVSDGAVRVVVVVPLLLVASRDLAAAAMVAAAAGSVLLPVLVGRRVLGPLVAKGVSSGEGSPFHVGAAVAFAWPAAVIAVADQVLVNGGPLLVMLGGGANVGKIAGLVFAATMLVRIPVFVFQGLATSMLPNLTRLHATAEGARFRRAVWRAAAGLAGVAAVIVVTAATIGPAALQAVYGSEYTSGRLELALLGVGVGCYLATSTFSQALLALDCGRVAALGWMASAVVFLGVYAVVPGEALFRVSTAFAVGTAAAVPLLGLALTRRGRQG